MVDVARAGDHRVYQAEDLPTGEEAATGRGDAHEGVHEILETKALHDRRHEQEPGVGDEVGLVEAHHDAVNPARYWLHWKCLLSAGNWGV